MHGEDLFLRQQKEEQLFLLERLIFGDLLEKKDLYQ